MGDCKISITVGLKNSEGEMENHQIELKAELPGDGPMVIDNVEQAVLKINKEAIRQAISVYFEELSKKKHRSK